MGSCTTDRVTHFHVINGGRKLNNLLEPEPEQGEIPNECVRNLCKLMMASNGKMKEEIHQLYWQCKNCLNLDGVAPILEPGVGSCLKCTEDKLASAEQVVMALSQDILNTWREEKVEPAGNVNYKILTGRELRLLAYSPHNREGSGLIEKAWVDPRGMIISDDCGDWVQLYSHASCFCSPIHTTKSMYQLEGAYWDWDTDEPLGDLEEEEISTSNLCDNNSLWGSEISENEGYYCKLPISDISIHNHTMSSNSAQGNDSQANNSRGMDLDGPQNDGDRRVNAVSAEGDIDLPYDGSKALVTAKKGFTKFFKSIAFKELAHDCRHTRCYTKSLTLSESYEATTLCKSITLLESGERGQAEFASLDWLPQGIKRATLTQIKARKEYLLRKSMQAPVADRWKQWSGEEGKPYVTKTERKRRKGQSEHCLVSLQDLGLLVKSAQKATQGGQSLDVWLHGAGRRTLHAWAQRASNAGIAPSQPHAGAPVGVSTVASGGHVTTGEGPAGVVGAVGAATHQAAYTGGSNPSYWDPQLIAQMVQVQMQLQNMGVREGVDKNSTSN